MYDANLVLTEDGQYDDYNYIIFLENNTVDITEVVDWQKLVFNPDMIPTFPESFIL